MNRLKSFRLIEGLTQRELGEFLNVSPQLISAVESGSRALTFDISPLGYSEARFELPDMSEPLHRQKAATTVSSTNRAKELLRVAGEVFAELKAINTGSPDQSLDPLGTPDSFEAVEHAAVYVRLLLNLEEAGPIKNLTAAIERSGICLLPITSLKGVDGISSWVDGQPVVGLSPTVSGDRFRFSLAHELAHLLLHRRKGGDTEDQANRFAGAVLIPEADADAVFPDAQTLYDFAQLKTIWGVSIAALIYRAHELGYVDDRRYRSLQIQMSRWRKTEPGEFAPAYGSLLPRLWKWPEASMPYRETWDFGFSMCVKCQAGRGCESPSRRICANALRQPSWRSRIVAQSLASRRGPCHPSYPQDGLIRPREGSSPRRDRLPGHRGLWTVPRSRQHACSDPWVCLSAWPYPHRIAGRGAVNFKLTHYPLIGSSHQGANLRHGRSSTLYVSPQGTTPA